MIDISRAYDKVGAPIVNSFSRAFSRLERVGTSISMIAVFLIMIAVTGTVLGRETIGLSVSGVHTVIVLYLMPIAVYFVISQLESGDDHIKVELLTSRMPEVTLLARNLIYKGLMLIILFWIVRGTFFNFLESYAAMRTTGGTYQFPVWVSDFIVPFGFGLLLLRMAISLFADLRDLGGRIRGVL